MRKIFAALLFFALAGSAQADQLDDIPAGQWLAIPNSNLFDLPGICAHPVPPFPQNSDDCRGVRSYSGGFMDTSRRRLVVIGGGHGDYSGNEVYAYDLDTFTWSRPWGPS